MYLIAFDSTIFFPFSLSWAQIGGGGERRKRKICINGITHREEAFQDRPRLQSPAPSRESKAFTRNRALFRFDFMRALGSGHMIGNGRSKRREIRAIKKKIKESESGSNRYHINIIQ